MSTTLRSRLAASLAAACLCLACLSADAQTDLPDFRLPEIAHPTQYRLDLTILPGEPVFQGSAVIDIELTRHTEVLWLNAKDLTIKQVTVSANRRPRAARWQMTDEFLGVDFPELMGPGPVQIEIRYSGKLDERSNVGSYRRKAGNDWYVYTAFTPIDARRAFPCFDEPGYKAPWAVTLHVKRDQAAVANAPAVSETDEPGGMKRVTFAPTQPLPSEVVAFAVGPFDFVDAGVAGRKGIHVRIITPRGRAAEAAAARTVTQETLARLEQYTGIPYPWDKLDHLAVLDMPFGAIENPGLITYRDAELLAPQDQDTLQRQRSMRAVMAHEMAHQWFGNLVTQAWWNDVWLSEGFATWLGTKIGDTELPPFERNLTITSLRNRMLASDLPGMRPVRLDMHSRRETDDVYNDVVYSKGAAILEMLEDWLGAEPFQHSLRRYLLDHQFGNATSADLSKAILQESGVDAGPVLLSFLDRPEAPLLRFKLTSNAGAARLVIEQGDHPWTVPVCYHPEAAARQCVVTNTSHAEVVLAGAPGWVWPNAYGSGYYRCLLAHDLLDGLVEGGYSQLEEPERLALAGDLERLTGSGEVSAAEVLSILPLMARDGTAHLKARAAAIALELALEAPEDIRGSYARWLRNTMGFTAISSKQAHNLEEVLRDKK